MDKVKIWASRHSSRRIGIAAFGVVLAVIGMSLLTFSQSRAATSCTGVAITSTMSTASIQTALSNNLEGTTFCFQPGTFRLTGQIVPRSNQKLIGATDAAGKRLSIISGAKVLSSPSRELSYWVYGSQTQQNTVQAYECGPGYTACNYPEGVFINNTYLRQEATLAEVGPGDFYFDYPTDKIYIADDPTGKNVETSIAMVGIYGRQGEHFGVQIKDLIVEKFLTPGTSGTNVAAIKVGTNWLIENSEIRLNHNLGIQAGAGLVARGNYIHHNGKYGVADNMNNGLFENNEVAYNNNGGFGNTGDAGGTKFSNETTDLIIRGNYVHHNDGVGLWTDGRGLRITYENNFVEYNSNAGILHEVSYDAIIRNNVVRNNGTAFVGKSVAWSANIYLNTSQNVEIYGNKVSESKDFNGITIFNADRSKNDPTGIYNYKAQNNSVHDNSVVIGDALGTASGNLGMEIVGTGINNKWTNNTYYLANPPGKLFSNGDNITALQWQGLGQDTTGIFKTLAEAPAPVPSPRSMGDPVDANPPTVSLTAPTSGAAVSGSAVIISALANDDRGVTKVEFFNGATKIAEDTSSPYSVTWNTTSGVPNGAYSLSAKAWDATGKNTTSTAVSVAVNNNTAPAQTPYTTTPTLPATIEAENFDKGGEGIAYHDLTAVNSGNAYRTSEGVDLVTYAGNSNGHRIGWIQAGEWLEYTIYVPTSGTYKFQASVANEFSGTTFHMEVNGVNKTGSLVVPNTNSDTVSATVIKDGISLSVGTQVIRIVYDVNASNGFAGDLDWIKLSAMPTAITQAPYKGTLTLPAIIEAENFDTGGEGVAYHDLTAVNSGNIYRTGDGVDIAPYAGNSNGHRIGWIFAGEWLEYTVNVPTTNTYRLEAKVAITAAGATFHMDVDGVNKTGTIAVPSTGSDTVTQTLAKDGVSLTAGTHVIRIAYDTNSSHGDAGNLDWFRLIVPTL